MQFIANYEIESEMSVVSDDTVLRFQHPKGRFQARIKNIVRDDYSTPFVLSVQLVFEAPNLMLARDITQDRLTEFLNILAFATSAGVRRARIKQIVDRTPMAVMRDCLFWADSVRHRDPTPFLDESIARSIEYLLQFDPPPAVRRALRWYRIGVNASAPEDQFQYFWFALEILAEDRKAPEKVPDRCPHCKSALFCETCETHPTHRPYAKQAIRALIQAVETACDEEALEALDKSRNALMHGATLKEIEKELPKSDDHIVDVLGKILFKALIHQFPKEIFEEGIQIASPTTYLHRRMSSFAHVSTVIPKGADGELDLDSVGLKVSIGLGGPPQSGQPSIIVMTHDQCTQLAVLTREKGDHQDLCKRVYETVKVVEGKVMASVLSTDMVRIRETLKRGESGSWQALFREIINANPPSGSSITRSGSGGSSEVK